MEPTNTPGSNNDQQTLANRRRLKRYRLYADIEIIDTLSNKRLGKLVDIHQEGLLLIGDALALNASHQIKLFLPSMVNLQREFQLGIECIWCHPSEGDDDLFWSGCGIIDKSDIASACITSLVNIRS